MRTAHEWKRYYADERLRLGEHGLRALLDRAEPLDVDRTTGAIVVPHTRLDVTGDQVAAAVATVLASGADRVLALGVLHGARRSDHDRVAAARAGDPVALVQLRGVHDETGLAAEEFSLDAFGELLALGAAATGRSVEVVRRYPFLVGDDPSTLPGLDDLVETLADGAALVVTTDPIHHGVGYATPPDECRPADDPATVAAARAAIVEQFDALSEGRFADFVASTETHRSDFRDTGPTMAALVGPGFETTLHALELVDYADALAAPRPSWVAGALATVAV